MGYYNGINKGVTYMQTYEVTYTLPNQPTRSDLLAAIETAKATMDANRTPETMQAYVNARNAHGDWLVANGHRTPGRRSGYAFSPSAKRARAEHKARYECNQPR